MAKVRINVTIAEELKEWLDKQCEAYGMNYSSMVAMALAQYKQQAEALTAMGNVMDMLGKIEQMQKVVGTGGEANDKV